MNASTTLRVSSFMILVLAILFVSHSADKSSFVQSLGTATSCLVAMHLVPLAHQPYSYASPQDIVCITTSAQNTNIVHLPSNSNLYNPDQINLSCVRHTIKGDPKHLDWIFHWNVGLKRGTVGREYGTRIVYWFHVL